jgi:prepilin-type N-terminal cleavage/methylation domain-containing protein
MPKLSMNKGNSGLFETMHGACSMHLCHAHQARRIDRRQGFSLIEVMVSAVILGMLIIGVITVLRKSNDLDVTYVHYRRARAILDSCFEDTIYTPLRYNLMTNDSQAVLIDDRGTPSTNDDLFGMMRIVVSTQQINCGGGRNAPYKEIQGTINWTDGGSEELIDISKYVEVF